MTYGDDNVAFSEYLTKLQDEVRNDSKHKQLKKERNKMKSKVTGRLKKIFIILMCMTLAVCPVMTETVSAANVKTSNTTVKKKLSGWVKVQRGQVRYYRSGRYFKGCRRIGRNYYYFNANGILMKKDTTVRGVRYYIEDNGRVLGLKKDPSIMLQMEKD